MPSAALGRGSGHGSILQETLPLTLNYKGLMLFIK